MAIEASIRGVLRWDNFADLIMVEDESAKGDQRRTLLDEIFRPFRNKPVKITIEEVADGS